MKWLLLIYAFNLVEPRKLVDKFLNLSKASELRTIAALSGDNSNLTIAGPLLKPLLVPRVSGTESNKNVREFIIKHFELLGWHVELDAFIEDTPLGKIEFTNIVVTRDITAHKRLVMAAHYDSKYFKDFEFIGATDSSVPCAILMDIASTLNTAMALKEKGSDRYNTLQMIFFDGEEAFVNWTDDDSIYGARHLAKHMTETMVPLVNLGDGSKFKSTPIRMMEAMILLDLLGTKDVKISNSQGDTQWIWDRITRIEDKLTATKLLSPYVLKRNENGDPIFRPGQPTISSLALQDDHVPFLLLGVPICHVHVVY